MDNAKIELSGGTATATMLRELPNRVEKKALRAGISAATTPVARAAKAKAPRQSGLLKKSIGKKVKSYERVVVGIVGARKDVQGVFHGHKRVPAKYLHLVLGGTRHSAANPFLKAAYAATKNTAKWKFQQKVMEVTLKEATKLGGHAH